MYEGMEEYLEGEARYCENTVFAGSTKDFKFDKDDCEVKADVVVNEKETVRIWGQVKDCKGKPVEDALVKLLKKEYDCFKGLQHTVTDCDGFYQFDICEKDKDDCYKIIVGKAVKGKEKEIPVNYECCKKKDKCHNPKPMTNYHGCYHRK